MQTPSVTGFYLGLLGLIYAALALEVARLRRGNRVLFGDGRTSGWAARSVRMRISSNMCRSSPCWSRCWRCRGVRLPECMC